MRPTTHAIISASISTGLIYFLKSYPAALACFLSGVFIDIDHYLDYFLARKKFTTYKELNEFCDHDTNWKLYLFFHSYELILLFWWAIFYWNLNLFWGGIAIGMTTHMICDQFANPIKPLAYLFIYRWKYKFAQDKILTRILK